MAQQFRVVLLDDYDNVIKVEMESPVFEDGYRWSKDFCDALFDELLELNAKYNLVDYDNVPPMEFQRRESKKNGEWEKWRYLSDPIEDYYNL